MCRKKIYSINNAVDPSFKDPSCWVKSNQDILPFLEKIKKKDLSMANNLNKLDISKSTSKNSDISNTTYSIPAPKINLPIKVDSNQHPNLYKKKDKSIKNIRINCNILNYLKFNKILAYLYIL
tara:strand:+ start:531 stop:899 length:369 start_codon:yes stop_codon:yes gene_type:complete